MRKKNRIERLCRHLGSSQHREQTKFQLFQKHKQTNKQTNKQRKTTTYKKKIQRYSTKIHTKKDNIEKQTDRFFRLEIMEIRRMSEVSTLILELYFSDFILVIFFFF